MASFRKIVYENTDGSVNQSVEGSSLTITIPNIPAEDTDFVKVPGEYGIFSSMNKTWLSYNDNYPQGGGASADLNAGNEISQTNPYDGGVPQFPLSPSKGGLGVPYNDGSLWNALVFPGSLCQMVYGAGLPALGVTPGSILTTDADAGADRPPILFDYIEPNHAHPSGVGNQFKNISWYESFKAAMEEVNPNVFDHMAANAIETKVKTAMKSIVKIPFWNNLGSGESYVDIQNFEVGGHNEGQFAINLHIARELQMSLKNAGALSPFTLNTTEGTNLTPYNSSTGGASSGYFKEKGNLDVQVAQGAFIMTGSDVEQHEDANWHINQLDWNNPNYGAASSALTGLAGYSFAESTSGGETFASTDVDIISLNVGGSDTTDSQIEFDPMYNASVADDRIKMRKMLIPPQHEDYFWFNYLHLPFIWSNSDNFTDNIAPGNPQTGDFFCAKNPSDCSNFSTASFNSGLGIYDVCYINIGGKTTDGLASADTEDTSSVSQSHFKSHITGLLDTVWPVPVTEAKTQVSSGFLSNTSATNHADSHLAFSFGHSDNGFAITNCIYDATITIKDPEQNNITIQNSDWYYDATNFTLTIGDPSKTDYTEAELLTLVKKRRAWLMFISGDFSAGGYSLNDPASQGVNIDGGDYALIADLNFQKRLTLSKPDGTSSMVIGNDGEPRSTYSWTIEDHLLKDTTADTRPKGHGLLWKNIKVNNSNSDVIHPYDFHQQINKANIVGVLNDTGFANTTDTAAADPDNTSAQGATYVDNVNGSEGSQNVYVKF